MMEQPKRSRVGLYIALAIIGLVVICGIGLAVWFNNFKNSPEGQKLFSAIGETSKMEDVMPNLTESLAAYQAKKGDLPDKIEDLAQFGATPATMAALATMKYTKPAKDAPADTVILERKMDFMQGSEMWMQVTKDLTARQVTITPLGHKSGIRIGTN